MRREELKEEATHGSASFPLACYGNEDKPLFVKLHWHDETEIVFLEKGRFTVDINMKKYNIDAPAFMFVNSGDIHSITGKEGNSESAVVFNLNMLSFEYFDEVQYRIIRPLIEKRIQFPKFIFPGDDILTAIEKIYRKIISESECNELSSYIRVKSYIYQLIAILYENEKFHYSDEVIEDDIYKIANIKKVLSYIHENYGQKISVEDMAKLLEMNPQYFCRYFKKLTGKTSTEYVNEIRIEKASELLARTERKIIDIAMYCGYENMGYFIKRFKEQKHISPSEYRNQTKKSK